MNPGSCLPKNEKIDHVDDYHGVKVSDPFRWLEDLESDKTKEWIAKQNDLSSQYFSALPLRQKIMSHLRNLNNHEKFVYPIVRNGKYFYYRKNGLQDQYVLYTRDQFNSRERVLIDPNEMGEAGTVALTSIRPSPNGTLVAYGITRSGSDWQEWRIRDVKSGLDLSDILSWIKFSIISWSGDNQGFFYSGYAEQNTKEVNKATLFYQKVFYHRLHTPQENDEVVFESPQQRELMFHPKISGDKKYLIIIVYRKEDDNNLVFIKDLGKEKGEFVPLVRDFTANYVFLGSEHDLLWFRTNEGAPNGCLMEFDASGPKIKPPRLVIGETRDVMERASVLDNKYFVTYVKNAHNVVKAFNREGEYLHDVTLPGLGSVAGFDGTSSDKFTYYHFSDFIRPIQVYRYDIEKDQSLLFLAPALPYNPDIFETNQIFFQSKDGARIPMFITHKKNLALDGRHPVLLYGYGGFGHSVTPVFSPANLHWLLEGGIYAVPNLRGGGEYGDDWHNAGRKLLKQNTFNDFISAADWLIENHYTSKGLIATYGRSNGGLLVAACMLRRPELFSAVVPVVGVLDMLRFSKFTIGWSWESEYGSVENKEEFLNLLSYSPVHNIGEGREYPATLVITGDHDDRVFPAHSFKFTAALQNAQAGQAPILLRVEKKVGHGHGKSTSNQIFEQTDILTFIYNIMSRKPHRK